MTYAMKGGTTNMGCCTYNASCSPNRGFLTKAEKIDMLKGYQKELEAEVRGITERIAELKDEE